MKREVHCNLPEETAGTNVVNDRASLEEIPLIAIKLETKIDLTSGGG